MTNRFIRCAGVLLPVVILLMLLLPAVPAAASPGLQVSGASLVTGVSPGEVLTHKMTVTADTACDVVIQAGGIGQAADGTYSLLDAASDTSPYSARRFITIDKQTLHLEPGVPGEITATIVVPQDAGDGGRYAMINIRTMPSGSGGVGVATAVNVPVYLTLKDSRLDHSGRITGITTGSITSGSPVEIFTALQNTGNHHYKIKGKVVISDVQGAVLDTIFCPLTSTSVIPAMTRQLKVTFIPEGELPPGIYTVKAKVMLEDGTLLDESGGSFEVKVLYVPPLPPASLTIMPAAASSLETGDGKIAVDFPKGAVTEAVTITINDYPVSQLPPLPEDYAATATCFRISGLNGLLAKEATLKVKYTADDLETAKGTALRLKLARWDEGDRQWTMLNTTIDESNMVLTAKTDRFSVWAVLVSPHSKMDLLLIIAGSIAGIIIGLFTVLWFEKGKNLKWQ